MSVSGEFSVVLFKVLCVFHFLQKSLGPESMNLKDQLVHEKALTDVDCFMKLPFALSACVLQLNIC